MTDAELIAAALARLEADAHEDAVTVWLCAAAWDGKDEVLTKPLAALIRASDKVRVDDCGCDQCHALIALCRAMVGPSCSA
jgi:hypothetical protein